MSTGLNKVMLIGYLGAEPELKYFADGKAFANVRLATNQTFKNKETGEKEQRTEWHSVCFRQRLAEVVGEYCHKGSLVYVEGSLRTRCWEDEAGSKHWTTEIMGQQLQMLAGGQAQQADKPLGAAQDDELPF